MSSLTLSASQKSNIPSVAGNVYTAIHAHISVDAAQADSPCACCSTVNINGEVKPIAETAKVVAAPTGGNNYSRPEGQNVGNFMTDRNSSRVVQPPGGASQIFFGGDSEPATSPLKAKVDSSHAYEATGFEENDQVQAQHRPPPHHHHYPSAITPFCQRNGLLPPDDLPHCHILSPKTSAEERGKG